MRRIKIDQLVAFNPSRPIKKGSVAPFIDMAALSVDSRDISEIGSRQYKGGGSRFANGDTLFARITPCLENGKTAKVSSLAQDVNAHGSTEFIVMAALEPEFDEDFVYYLARLPEFRSYAKSRMEGTSGRQRVSWQAISQFESVYLPQEVRKEIGSTLARLDDKIELNHQTNQTLEQIAQAIFKSWFVDFEPVKAKQHIRSIKGNDEQTERAAQAVIAGAVNLDVITTATDLSALDRRLIQALGEKLAHQTEAQREQLATTASHFPDQLVESELGWIPGGWVPTTLSKMIRLIGGGTPKKSESRYWNGAIPWFSVKDAPDDGQVFVLDTDLKITDAGLSESSTRLLDEGTTIISARGTVGRLALVGVPMAMNQSCYGVTGADGIPPIFNYFNLRRAVDVLKQNTHGAVFDTITRETFETVDQIMPQKKVIRCFEVSVESLIFQVKSNGQLSRSLAQLRGVLLPKLLSGELTPNQSVQPMRVTDG